MGSYRSRRFLIDSIDERLGDVEKEKKFDIAMIFVGLVLVVSGALLLYFCSTKAALAVLYIFMVMLGLALCYVMTKEYMDDCKKAKSQNQPR